VAVSGLPVSAARKRLSEAPRAVPASARFSVFLQCEGVANLLDYWRHILRILGRFIRWRWLRVLAFFACLISNSLVVLHQRIREDSRGEFESLRNAT
jgi:hypothetical protein